MRFRKGKQPDCRFATQLSQNLLVSFDSQKKET